MTMRNSFRLRVLSDLALAVVCAGVAVAYFAGDRLFLTALYTLVASAVLYSAHLDREVAILTADLSDRVNRIMAGRAR